MDPVSNSLLRTFECATCDLHRFISSSWEPPVKLTTHEREIVDRCGSTLLQGRGGTGKTLCLISRSGLVFCFELWSLWYSGQGLERSACESRDMRCLTFHTDFTKIIWLQHFRLPQSHGQHQHRSNTPEYSLFRIAIKINIKVWGSGLGFCWVLNLGWICHFCHFLFHPDVFKISCADTLSFCWLFCFSHGENQTACVCGFSRRCYEWCRNTRAFR